MCDMKIRYSAKVEQTQVLGPGKRAVLWVHGCCFDCPGCIAPGFKEGSYTEADPQTLARWYLDLDAEGLTISGGEPMLQAEALARMIREIRGVRDTGVIVYTGFVYETLLEKARQDDGIQSFLEQIDLLIDGPYIQERNHGEPYRGSDNQRLLALTDRYSEQLKSYYAGQQGRQIEIRISGENTLLVGVPSRDQAEIWNNIKSMAK